MWVSDSLFKETKGIFDTGLENEINVNVCCGHKMRGSQDHPVMFRKKRKQKGKGLQLIDLVNRFSVQELGYD